LHGSGIHGEEEDTQRHAAAGRGQAEAADRQHRGWRWRCPLPVARSLQQDSTGGEQEQCECHTSLPASSGLWLHCRRPALPSAPRRGAASAGSLTSGFMLDPHAMEQQLLVSWYEAPATAAASSWDFYEAQGARIPVAVDASEDWPLISTLKFSFIKARRFGRKFQHVFGRIRGSSYYSTHW